MTEPTVVRGASIFRQTLMLLAGSLLFSQLISIALIISLPAPRPDFTRMTEIADSLSGRSDEDRAGGRRRYALLPIDQQAAAPGPAAGMIENAELRAELAQRLDVNADRVRLYYRSDAGVPWPFRRSRSGGSVAMRHGEALFFDSVIAGLETGQGWRTLRTAERPLISAWQWRWILWFVVSLLLLLPVGWVFARRLSRPISNFADAADRIGRDATSPPVRLEGPVELRKAAHALNGMQARIGEYLRERTAMIGAIAHDLRTPLARIGFRVEGASEAIREAVQRDIQEMTAMIGATMEFVRGTTTGAERIRVDLSGLLVGLADLSREMGRKVSVDVEPECLVSGEPIGMRRLFGNLIDNAWKFGGSCEIRAQRTAGIVRVGIADRGPGLAPEMLERVFEPFVRADPSRSRATGGVGLGLTIARTIARDHGGTLVLSNRPGGGLVATVEIPAL